MRIMVFLTSGAVLACVFGVISGHADYFLTSPDVDIQAGFFPDSGYMNSNPQRANSRWSQSSHSPSVNYDRQSTRQSYHNRFDPAPRATGLLSKRLQLLMSRLSAHKHLGPNVKPARMPTSHVENTNFLHLFTGSKDSKS